MEPKSQPPNPFLPIQTQHFTFLSSLSNSNPLKTHLDSTFESLGNALQSGLSRLASPSAPIWSPACARMTPPSLDGGGPAHRFDLAMSMETIKEHLAGVPVHTLSNSAEEFVLVSDVGSGKFLGLLCFKEEDAEALLDQMRSMNQDMRPGSKVVALALNKVKILCKVNRSDLKQLLLVSKTIHGVTLIAREMHFAYTTPSSKPVFRNIDLEDDGVAPNVLKNRRLQDQG